MRYLNLCGSIVASVCMAIAAPQGQSGAQGQPGAGGQAGQSGAQTPSGAQGQTDRRGQSGAEGQSGAQTPSGAQGQTDRRGHSGAEGQAGRPGTDSQSGAHGQSSTEGRSMRQGQSGHEASSGATSDAEFVRKAASGGMMEVELGKLAQQKGSSSRVKQIGKALERDHSKANQELKKIASSQGLTVPDQMESEHRSHIDQLRNLSGQEFDQQFMQMQAEHHRKDIAEFQQEANQGQSSRVKDFASKQLPVLQRHLSMVESNQGSAAREGASGTDSHKGMSGRSGSDSTTGHGTSDQGTSTSGQGTSTGGQKDQKNR